MPNYYNNPNQYVPQNQAGTNNYVQPNYNWNNIQAPYTTNQQINTGMNFNNVTVVPVSGEEGANSYPVAMGTTILLMDYDKKTFWLKSNDGLSTRLTRHTFKIDDNEVPENNEQDFVSKKEFYNLKKSVDTLIKNNKRKKED